MFLFLLISGPLPNFTDRSLALTMISTLSKVITRSAILEALQLLAMDISCL